MFFTSRRTPDRISRSYRCLTDDHRACVQKYCNCICHGLPVKRRYRVKAEEEVSRSLSDYADSGYEISRGRRLLDGPPEDLEPGDYQYTEVKHSFGLPSVPWIWRLRPPNGSDWCALSIPKYHTIAILDDGTITVKPSVWFHMGQPGAWHGLIVHGMWIGFDPEEGA